MASFRSDYGPGGHADLASRLGYDATPGRGSSWLWTAGEIAAGVLFEPIDWALTAREIYNNPRSPWSYAGLVPFVPAGAGKLAKGALNNAADPTGDIGRNLDVVAPSAGATHGHHPLPTFLGGNPGQTLSRVDPAVHREFHSLLGQNLKGTGSPLNVGGRGGSALDWADYMNANPGAQRRAFEAVLDASRSMDVKHGTNITQDVWRNIMGGNFRPQP